MSTNSEIVSQQRFNDILHRAAQQIDRSMGGMLRTCCCGPELCHRQPEHVLLQSDETTFPRDQAGWLNPWQGQSSASSSLADTGFCQGPRHKRRGSLRSSACLSPFAAASSSGAFSSISSEKWELFRSTLESVLDRIGSTT